MRPLDEMIDRAHRLVDVALKEHFVRHAVAGTVVLFSGGNDSTVLTHLMRERATHAAHCNTGIGIEATRQFVRDRCQDWGLPLLEFSPAEVDSYRAHVVEFGFPGPGHHFKMYQRLKERQLRTVRRHLVKNGRRERVLFLAGRRRAESNRRANVPEYEREGSIVWCSPLVEWEDHHIAEYRSRFDLPRNEVSDMLHMSGECLCGAFAAKGELDEIRFFFPEVAEEIDALAVEALERGVDPQRCQWGWGAYRDDPEAQEEWLSGPLCSSCALRRTA